MICNRRAFVLATGCPQVSVNLSFPDLEFCSDPEYTDPHPCEQCVPQLLPAPDVNFPGAQPCISLYLTFTVIDPDNTMMSVTFTAGCFSFSAVIPIKLPCFRKILTRSSGKNNGTALILTTKEKKCYMTAHFTSAFSLASPSKYMARNKQCIIPECLNITLTPIVVGYGTHDADDIGGANVYFGASCRLNDIHIMFPLMCDLPPAVETKLSTPGEIVHMVWQWNKEMAWKVTAKVLGPCDLRKINVQKPIVATCSEGQYYISVLFTRFGMPDLEKFRGPTGPTGDTGAPGERGRDASYGDIGPCPELDPHICSEYNDDFCGGFCECRDPWIRYVDCPFAKKWNINAGIHAYWSMFFTNDGRFIAWQQYKQHNAWSTCPGAVMHSVYVADPQLFYMNAPVGEPELEY